MSYPYMGEMDKVLSDAGMIPCPRWAPGAARAAEPFGPAHRSGSASGAGSASRMSLAKKVKIGLEETRNLILGSRILLGSQFQGPSPGLRDAALPRPPGLGRGAGPDHPHHPC